MLEDDREVLCFACPTGQCQTTPGRAREFRMKLVLIERGLELFHHQLNGHADYSGLLRITLAERPRHPEHENPNDKHISVYCRLTPVQEYLYGYLSLPDRSALANAALADLIERKGQNV
jgi:hypothetical protein